MAAQIGAGLAAGFTSLAITGAAVPLVPGASYGWSAVSFAEIVYTFVLCFVVLNVGTNCKGKLDNLHGLAVGSCIVAGGYAIGSVSGGSLNPAVSFALDTSHAVAGGKWINCLVYSVFEVTGAALAAGAFYATRSE